MLAKLRLFAPTAATMIAFAANSVLCRLALRGQGGAAAAIDPTSYTALRLVSGAAVLAAIVAARSAGRRASVVASRRGDRTSGEAVIAAARGGDRASDAAGNAAARGRGRASDAAGNAASRGDRGLDGSWISALALAAYATAFSYAYVQIPAGTGALLLFGAVQLTMIAGALVRGERPRPAQWLGYGIAAAGMVVINLPGLGPPPAIAAVLMIGAGVAWGVYSLRGRGAARPIAVTAANFVRAAPIAAAVVAIALGTGAPLRASALGVGLAVASGAVASGLGYCLWYLVLPRLGAARGAIVQLAVPAITAGSAVAWLDEPLRRPVAIGGAIVLGGLAIALWPRRANAVAAR